MMLICLHIYLDHAMSPFLEMQKDERNQTILEGCPFTRVEHFLNLVHFLLKTLSKLVVVNLLPPCKLRGLNCF